MPKKLNIKTNTNEEIKLNKKINDKDIIKNKVITLSNEIIDIIKKNNKQIDEREEFVLSNSEEISKFRERLGKTISFKYKEVKPIIPLFYINKELEVLKDKLDAKKLELKIININIKETQKNKIILQNNIVNKFINEEINKAEFLTCLYYLEKNVRFCISKYFVIKEIVQCGKNRLQKELEDLKTTTF